MSATATTNEPELGSYEALAAIFADDASLPDPASETPSPAPQAERATATPGTDAAPPAHSPEAVAPPDAAPVPAERTTFPKWWKGSEEEWQTARAEQNRATNRERDRAERLAEEAKAAADRLAFLEAQLSTRDTHLVDNLTDAYREQWIRQYGSENGLAAWVTEKLKVSQAAGNEGYYALRQQREQAEAEAATTAAAAQAGQTTVAQAREADARLTFVTHLQETAIYAVGQGVAGLDLDALYGAAFQDAEIADDIEESRAPDIAEERRARLVARVYRRADALVKAKVDAAAGAKVAAVASAPADLREGRATALGGTAAGTGAPLPDYSPDAMERELDAHYKTIGWGAKPKVPLLR